MSFLLHEIIIGLSLLLSYHHLSDIGYLRSVLPDTTESEFFDYLLNLSAADVTVYAIPEGSVVFPKVPLLRVEGPLPVCQLLETTLLTLVNFARYTRMCVMRYV